MGLFRLKKTMEISASHKLELPYPSKCNKLHGHNWKIIVECMSLEEGLENGMIIDFSTIKNIVMELDHENLNVHLFHPTAENIAKHIYTQIGKVCRKVTVIESEGNEVSYEDV